MENMLRSNIKMDWINKERTYRECPKCHQGELDTRIPRGPLFKHFLFWLPYKRYRCSNCQAKIYILEKK